MQSNHSALSIALKVNPTSALLFAVIEKNASVRYGGRVIMSRKLSIRKERFFVTMENGI